MFPRSEAAREPEGEKQMNHRRFILPAFAALAFAAFLAPSTARAQGSVWDRIRDRAEQERDRDNGRNGRRDDGRYGRGGGRMSDYERRELRDLARRINDQSKDFQRDIDRSLDDSRANGSRREDNINQEARDLRNAAERFKNVAGDDNDLYRSSDEARQLLDQASRISRMLGRVRLDGHTGSDWNRLRSDLRTVANIYGLRFDEGGGYNGRDDDWRRNRDNRDNRRNGYPY
jgi:hypothetical protein